MEYYDMKMVTFGVNDGEELVVAFPVFVQDHTRESMTLYELETVKVVKMHTGQVDALRTQELAKLTSAVVPLQRLKIRDDGRPAENPENKSEVDIPPHPRIKQNQTII